MKKPAAAALLLFFGSATARGADLEKHSKVDVTSVPKAGNLELTFKVLPTNGLHINLDGPWKLEIKGHEGLAFDKDTLAKKDLNEGLTGFVVTTKAAPAKPAGELEYALTAFVCTDDKTACFREVHNGKATWSVAAK